MRSGCFLNGFLGDLPLGERRRLPRCDGPQAWCRRRVPPTAARRSFFLDFPPRGRKAFSHPSGALQMSRLRRQRLPGPAPAGGPTSCAPKKSAEEGRSRGGSLEEDGGAKLAPLENPPTAHAQPAATIRQLPKHPPRWHTAGNDIIQRKEKGRDAIASRPFSFLFHTPAYAGEVRSPGSGGAAIPGGFPRFCFLVVL